MGDLFLFAAIVGLVVVVGILVGMIVAGRIDRLMMPPPAAPAEGEDRVREEPEP
jgi:hypothetical protein